MNEFNPYILLVLKWLQNKDSVSQEELKLNYNAAWRVLDNCKRTQDATLNAAAKAAYTAGTATYAAGTAYDAAYWLNKAKHSLNAYFKLTKEDREAYEEQAKYLNVLGVNNG